MDGFRAKLTKRQGKINSLVCTGLDPLSERIPECVRKSCTTVESATLLWMKEIIDATSEYTSMYKIQRAHYEALQDGRRVLQNIVDYIHFKYSDIPVFLDCKRGDIGRTQVCYRIAQLDIDGADGMNYSPWMGSDCFESLIDECNPNKAIVGLCRTSNPSAWEIQDVKLADGRRLWELVAEKILGWAKKYSGSIGGVTVNAGLVIGAAHCAEHLKYCSHWTSEEIPTTLNYSEHLSKVRKIVGNKLWFLIPGIGKQGGAIEETIKTSYVGFGSIAINSSSGIIFASSKTDFASAAANEARVLRAEINKYTK